MAVYTAIDDPSAYFKVQLYTGDGSANHAITFDDTDTDMQPDLVWIKNRDAADSHCLFDSVRGATKLLSPDTQAIETTDADTLDSFTSDGFQVDADDKVNTNAEKYVAWCWKEASGIFDIVTYEGTGSAKTESHSLSAVPHLMIIKNIDTGSESWLLYHASLGNGKALKLDVNTAAGTNTAFWNDTTPTSSVFTVGSDGASNDNTKTHISYLWSEKQGFSKFGLYTGNGNADGAFVYTGFKPAFVIVKLWAAAYDGQWTMHDNKRANSFNSSTGGTLYPHIANAEATGLGRNIHFFSNGFKFTGSDEGNTAGEHVYIAFAEAPFVNSNGVPCNAR